MHSTSCDMPAAVVATAPETLAEPATAGVVGARAGVGVDVTGAAAEAFVVAVAAGVLGSVGVVFCALA